MRSPVSPGYQVTTPFGWVKGYPLHTNPADPVVPPDQRAKYPGAGYGFHLGVDLVTADRNIFQPEMGNDQVVAWNGLTEEGNTIYIAQGNRRHALCHLESFSISSSLVTEGQRIGLMGQTGAAQGVHLHWAVTVGGELVDPLSLVEEEDMPNSGDVDNAYLKANGRSATDEEKKVYTSKPWSAPDGLYNAKVLVDLVNFKNDVIAKQAQIDAMGNPTELKPGIYKV